MLQIRVALQLFQGGLCNMLKVISEKVIDGALVVEYSKDGKTVSHTTRSFIQEHEDSIEQSVKPSELEQILFETQYQTMLLEMGGGA